MTLPGSALFRASQPPAGACAILTPPSSELLRALLGRALGDRSAPARLVLATTAGAAAGWLAARYLAAGMGDRVSSGILAWLLVRFPSSAMCALGIVAALQLAAAFADDARTGWTVQYLAAGGTRDRYILALAAAGWGASGLEYLLATSTWLTTATLFGRPASLLSATTAFLPLALLWLASPCAYAAAAVALTGRAGRAVALMVGVTLHPGYCWPRSDLTRAGACLAGLGHPRFTALRRESQCGRARYHGRLPSPDARRRLGGCTRPAAPRMRAAELRHGPVRRGHRAVLQAASVTVPAAGVIGVVGVNGAGKSTLFHALAGTLAGGAAAISGLDHDPGAAIAFAPQETALPDWLSVADVARLYGTTIDEVADRSPGLLIEELVRHQAHTLSAGQRQALSVALALAAQLPLTLLDEPFAPLDFRRRLGLVRLLRERRGEHAGGIVLLSSQSAADLLDTCDWILVLRDGCYVHSGAAASLTAGIADPAKARQRFEEAVLTLLGAASPLRLRRAGSPGFAARAAGI
jgi:ABC-type multidrug transport system ATPase subunit